MVQGERLRGFYLREELGSYENAKTGKQNAYKYKPSYAIHFTPPDSGWSSLDREEEWRTNVSVKYGEAHTFWVDGLSVGTHVSGIDIEGRFTYRVEGEVWEEYVYASECVPMTDADGNVTGILVTLTADDWPEADQMPSFVNFKVIVCGDYDENNVDNNRFKFHHLRGRGVCP